MLIIFIFCSFVGLIIQYILRKKFKKYSKIEIGCKLSGYQTAKKILKDHNITNVNITFSKGYLSDHYNPINRTVNLSEENYYSKSIAAVAVAAHECGHAIQHHEGYKFLKLRSRLVPILSITSRYFSIMLMMALLMLNYSLIPLKIAIVLYSTILLFSMVTLPVEFDASKKALNWINNITTEKEYLIAKDALFWAAMTYVINTVSALLNFLYFVYLLNRRN